MERREFLKTMAGAGIVGADLINSPYRILIPSISVQESASNSERKWATFAYDLSKLKSEIGVEIAPENISVVGMASFEDTTRETTRKLQLKTAERTNEAYNNVLEQGIYSTEEMQKIFLTPLSGLELTQDTTITDGARTDISIQGEGYKVVTHFGRFLGRYVTNIGNESFHQEIASETIRVKHPGYEKFIIEALSFLSEWDLIRSSRTGSPDLYVELPIESLRESLRSLRTEYFLPYEKTEDYYNILKAYGLLSDITKRDGALISFAESVASRIASQVVHEKLGTLKEDIFAYLAQEKTNKPSDTYAAKAIAEVLPEGEDTMIPNGLTQVLAIDHAVPATQQHGLNDENGYLVRGITYFRDNASISIIPVGKIVKASTNNGVAVDFSQCYEVGIQGSIHSCLFMPLSSFSQGELPNGTVINLTTQVGNLLKNHNLKYNFEGNFLRATTASSDEVIMGF